MIPETIRPMLASRGEPFDSGEHLFEIKWDGIRVLAFVEPAGHRLQNRRLADVTPRYPELAGLSGLPPGAVLDGEIVILADGRPDFQLMQSRWGVTEPRAVAALAREHPATYVAFDLLYEDGAPIADRPLAERRARLEALLAGSADPRVVFSEGVVGPGRAYFEQAASRGLEGVMAKRLDSRYLPGLRTEAWVKLKAMRTLQTAIIGFTLAGPGELRGLIVAAPDEAGVLRSVGRVGTGLSARQREELLATLRARVRETPLVACAHDGTWVEPGLYCEVRYLERTKAGELRAPVFRRMVE